MLFGRTVVRTELDDVPAKWRLAPGLLVVTEKEIAALAKNDGPTFRALADLCLQDDLAALEKLYGSGLHG